MESLGNDDVLSLNARMESLGNDDVSLQNANLVPRVSLLCLLWSLEERLWLRLVTSKL